MVILTFALCVTNICLTIGMKQRISILSEQQCLLRTRFFYQGDMACHRDVVRIMRDITPYVDHNTLHEVERIYTQSIPRLCIAESTDRKTRDYMKYGIYSSCNDAPDKTKKSKNEATLSFWMNSCAGTSYISIYVQLGLLTWTIPSKSHGSYMMRHTMFSRRAKL